MNWIFEGFFEGLKASLLIASGYYLSSTIQKDTLTKIISVKKYNLFPFISDVKTDHVIPFKIKPFTNYIVKILYDIQLNNDKQSTKEHESLFLIYYDIKNFKSTCYDPVSNELIKFNIDEKLLTLSIKVDTVEPTIGSLTILEF